MKVPSTGIVALTTMIVAVSALSGCGGQSRSPSVSTTDTFLEHVESAVAAAPTTTTTPTASPEDLDPSTYQALSAREFALLIKNPDASIGRKIVLYGVVTQFDTATGQNSFRAVTGTEPGDFKQNSIFYAHDQSILSRVVAQMRCALDEDQAVRRAGADRNRNGRFAAHADGFAHCVAGATAVSARGGDRIPCGGRIGMPGLTA